VGGAAEGAGGGSAGGRPEGCGEWGTGHWVLGKAVHAQGPAAGSMQPGAADGAGGGGWFLLVVWNQNQTDTGYRLMSS